MTVQLHPLTGAPLTAVGFRKPRHSRGEVGLQPIFPVMGGAPEDDAAAQQAAAEKAAAEKAEAEKAASDKAAADAAAAADKDKDKPDAAKTAELGYPADKEGRSVKPVADLSADEKVAYWTEQSKRHEKAWKGKVGADVTPEKYAADMAELAELRTQNMSATEKAVAEAKAEGRQEAVSELNEKVIQAHIDAFTTARDIDLTKNAELSATLEALDLKKFVKDGDVDTDKLVKVLGTLIPDPGKGRGRWPDNGGGKRGGNAPVKGLAAGADLYEQVHPKKS